MCDNEEVYYSELKVSDCTVVSSDVLVAYVTHPVFTGAKLFRRFEKTKKKVWWRHELDGKFGFEVKADILR